MSDPVFRPSRVVPCSSPLFSTEAASSASAPATSVPLLVMRSGAVRVMRSAFATPDWRMFCPLSAMALAVSSPPLVRSPVALKLSALPVDFPACAIVPAVTDRAPFAACVPFSAAFCACRVSPCPLCRCASRPVVRSPVLTVKAPAASVCPFRLALRVAEICTLPWLVVRDA